MGAASPPAGACRACVIRWGSDHVDDDELMAHLTEVIIETSRSEAAQATLSFVTRRDRKGRWTVQDADFIAPWTPIRIEACFGRQTEEVMRGYIREVRAEYPADRDGAVVKVICQDDSFALDRQHRRDAWGIDHAISDVEIVEAIAQRHGLEPDCKSERTGSVHQQDSTDIRFLMRLARERGCELIVRDGVLYFGPMRLDELPQPAIRVYAGLKTNCRQISIRDDGHQPDRVAIDIAEPGETPRTEVIGSELTRLGAEPSDTQGDGLEEFVWRVHGHGATDTERMRTIARQKADAASMKLSAEGELDGALYGKVLKCALPVDLDGAGERYDGSWYVDAVTHRFDGTGYSQRFSLLRNARRRRAGMLLAGDVDLGALA